MLLRCALHPQRRPTQITVRLSLGLMVLEDEILFTRKSLLTVVDIME